MQSVPKLEIRMSPLQAIAVALAARLLKVAGPFLRYDLLRTGGSEPGNTAASICRPQSSIRLSKDALGALQPHAYIAD
jgi:hypothetical protein